MYFISKGKFSVQIRVDHLKPSIIGSENDEVFTKPRYLVDGDHFGEISMIYECKRTATIRSVNYGTLARLQKSDYLELSKTYETLPSLMKSQIYKYHDEVSSFINIELEKIPYYQSLSLLTKQEIIYSMERCTYEKGSLICKKNEKAEKMFLIQHGIVEVAIKYDRRRNDQYFVIERLGRGAIINHRSFMIRDDADTDFVCKTSVSCYFLTSAKLHAIFQHRQDLKSAREAVKVNLLTPVMPIALDYIFHNNAN